MTYRVKVPKKCTTKQIGDKRVEKIQNHKLPTYLLYLGNDDVLVKNNFDDYLYHVVFKVFPLGDDIMRSNNSTGGV